MAKDLDVDERKIRIAQNARLVQMPEDDRRSLSLANFQVFERLRKSFVGRSDGAPEEIAAAGGQNDREDEDREQRLQIFAAADAPGATAGYDRLRCSSRYDCRITAAAIMSMSRCASRRL